MTKGRGDTSTGYRVKPVQEAPTLHDLGISKGQSHRWQRLADVPGGGGSYERRGLEPHVVNKLRCLRGAGESYGDVILRLAEGVEQH